MWVNYFIHTSAAVLSGSNFLQPWFNSELYIDLCELQRKGVKLAHLLSSFWCLLSLCLHVYVCIYPDTMGFLLLWEVVKQHKCSRNAKERTAGRPWNCTPFLFLWFYQSCIYLIFQYKGQEKNCSFITFSRKGQTKLKRIVFRSIENPAEPGCDFSLKANDQFHSLCLRCYLQSAGSYCGGEEGRGLYYLPCFQPPSCLASWHSAVNWYLNVRLKCLQCIWTLNVVILVISVNNIESVVHLKAHLQPWNTYLFELCVPGSPVSRHVAWQWT